MKNEYGFSMIKLLIFLAIVGGGVFTGFKMFPVYNNAWKVQDVFDSIARDQASKSESEIRKRLPELLDIKYIEKGDLPQEFFDNIEIKADGSRVVIDSSYHVTLWLLGPVSEMDEFGEYDVADLKGMDIVKHKLRFDYDFEPHAETP